MGHIIEMRAKTIVLAFLTVMWLNANAQAREPSESSLETVSSIYALPPFERAVCCIDLYNLEMVIRLAYAIDSHNSHKFRKYIMNRLMGRPMYENVCLTLELPQR